MNEVRLTGTITKEIIASTQADGTEHASTSLQFHKGNGAVLLFCFGERARDLARIKSGDLVRISGKVTIHRFNGKGALLVDGVRQLDARQGFGGEREER